MVTLTRAVQSNPAAAVALAIGIGGLAAIATAYFIQYVLLIAPCPLCLDQRKIWYAIIPVAFVVAMLAQGKAPRRLVHAGLIILVLAMTCSFVFALYHAGVEWKWWAGPADCTGPIENFGGAGSLLDKMQTTSLVRCDEAAWRFLGISLAGYNSLMSLAFAVMTFWALVRDRQARG